MFSGVFLDILLACCSTACPCLYHWAMDPPFARGMPGSAVNNNNNNDTTIYKAP